MSPLAPPQIRLFQGKKTQSRGIPPGASVIKSLLNNANGALNQKNLIYVQFNENFRDQYRKVINDMNIGWVARKSPIANIGNW